MPSSDYIKEFSDVFDQDAVGNLPGNVKLVLMDEYTPTEMPPRRVPIAIKDDLKKELDSLVSSGVSIRRKDRLWDRLGTPER